MNISYLYSTGQANYWVSQVFKEPEEPFNAFELQQIQNYISSELASL